MTYKIKLIEQNKIVAVTYKGNVSLDDRLSAVHELCSNYNTFRTFKLLINSIDASQKMSLNEQIIFGRYLAEREEFQGASVATVTPPTKCINQVIVKEAAELGYQITSFDCEQEAIEWLIEQP